MNKLLIKSIIGLSVLISLLAAAPAATAHAEDASNETVIHVVAWGESLGKIAQLYDVSMQAIMDLNDISDPNRIYVGQRLVISAPAQAGDEAAESVIHVVQPGETLFKISLLYNVRMDRIIAENGILNPSSIYSGQRLVIPGVSEAPDQEDTEDQGGPGDAVPRIHVVQRGETLSGIARMYGVSLWALAQANNISNLSVLYAGQVLTITEDIVSGIPQPTVTSGKQIVVVLHQQRAYAFEDGQLVNQFIVSTGRADTPTVLGSYRIYHKVASQRMRGPGYDLPNVQWVMYFFEGYSFHGTYWHNNFGTPMSHGCVNMRTSEAEWLYNWAPMGTAVLVLP